VRTDEHHTDRTWLLPELADVGVRHAGSGLTVEVEPGRDRHHASSSDGAEIVEVGEAARGCGDRAELAVERAAADVGLASLDCASCHAELGGPRRCRPHRLAFVVHVPWLRLWQCTNSRASCWLGPGFVCLEL
jgi:hypothetical protein